MRSGVAGTLRFRKLEVTPYGNGTATTRKAFERNWFTLTSLISRDFKLKYRRSVLGVVWSVLNPLLMMCVLAAVFSFFLRFAEIRALSALPYFGQHAVRRDERLDLHRYDLHHRVILAYQEDPHREDDLPVGEGAVCARQLLLGAHRCCSVMIFFQVFPR